MADGRSVASHSAHPAPQNLDDFASGRLNAGDAAWIENHLETCDPCSRALAVVSIDQDALVAQLRAFQLNVDSCPAAVQDQKTQTSQKLHDQEAFDSTDGPRDSAPAAGIAKTLAAERFRETPAMFGRYRIVSQLGRGAFGIVYQAWDDQLRRHVAIKVTFREFLSGRTNDSYLAEARTVASLDHLHIVPVYDTGQSESGDYYVVSRLIDGSDLANRLLQEPPTPGQSIGIVAAIAEALHYAHGKGLVHRDVKPANILIDTEGRAFLADFGIALREEEYGRGAGLAGTPNYMSPEQARGEGHRVDGRSDIYSLGVVLYELVTGRRPFQADDRFELLRRIAENEVRPPRQINDRISRELEQVCLKALMLRPSERYPTARDFAEDLRRLVEHDTEIVRASADTSSVAAAARVIPKGSGGQTVPFTVPFPRNPHFVGRGDDLRRVHEGLQASSRLGIRPSGLSGMGGIGKTQLAVEYAYSSRESYPDGVFWVNAAESLAEGVSHLYDVICPGTDERGTQDARIRGVAAYFRSHPAALLIFDNLQDPAELNLPLTFDVIPGALECRILFTTRSHGDGFFTMLELHTLCESAAIELLLQHPSRRQAVLATHPDHREAQRICALLGYLPLALEIAAAHLIRRSDAPLSAYREELLRRGALPVLDDPRGKLRSEDLPTRHEAAVSATLASQWNVLHDDNAKLLLRIAAQLSEATLIPLARLGLLSGLNDDEVGFFGSPLIQAVQELRSAGLVEELRETESGIQTRLHPLVRDFVCRQTGTAETSELRLACAARILAAYLQMARLEDQLIRRGIDAVQEDLITAIRLGGEISASFDRDLVWLRELLRVLQQEAHNLRTATNTSVSINQQMVCRAATVGADHVRAAASRRLNELGCPWLNLQWRAGHELRSLESILVGHSGAVIEMAVNADASLLASASSDATVRIWNLETGRLLRTLRGHADCVRSVAFTPGGERLVSGSDDGNLMIWETSTGRLLQSLQVHHGEINNVSIHPDGRSIFSASCDGTICHSEMISGNTIRYFSHHGEKIPIHGLAITSNGQTLVTGSDDGALTVWDVNTGKVVSKHVGHEMGVRHVAVSPQGQRALSVSIDGTVAMWDLHQSRQFADVNLPRGSVQTAAFTPDGRRLIVAFWSRRIVIWDIENQKTMGSLAGNERTVLSVTVTPDGNRIACGSLDRTIRVWNLAAVGGSATFGGHLRSVTDLAISGDGQLAVSVSDDSTIRVWGTAKGNQIHARGGDDDRELPLAAAATMTPDARKIVVALCDRDLLVWDRELNTEMKIVTGHLRVIEAIDVTPDGNLIISGDASGQLRVWDISTGQQILETDGGTEGIACLAVLPNGKSVIAARKNGVYQVYDLRSGSLLAEFGDGKHSPVRLKIHDPFECVSLSKDGTLTVWNLKAVGPGRTIRVGPSVRDFAVMPDRSLVITTGRDRFIRAIGFETGALLFDVVLDYRLQRVEIAGESRTILIGDRAGNLYGFHVSEGRLQNSDEG